MVTDPDVKRAFDWFYRFLDPVDWDQRKKAIEAHLDSVHTPHQNLGDAQAWMPISIDEDRMGWYLYLVETYLYTPYKYEPIQGSRILPIFKRMGINLDRLLCIHGVEERAARLVSAARRQPDSGLFELMTALLWARSNWPVVEFIPEAPPAKRSDLRVEAWHDEWFIECKRLAKSSDYCIVETVRRFDSRGKELHWVYCHLFQPYAPPEYDWVMDETVYSFPNPRFRGPQPLKNHFMVVDSSSGSLNSVHWRKEPL